MTARLVTAPDDVFVKLWNAAATVDGPAAVVKWAAGGRVPRWAVRVRMLALRKRGVELKPLNGPTASVGRM
jgi:hypothetical protein